MTRRAGSAHFPPMAKTEKQRPAATEHGVAEAARREARLAAALRENLKRRKAQAREQAQAEAKPEDED